VFGEAALSCGSRRRMLRGLRKKRSMTRAAQTMSMGR